MLHRKHKRKYLKQFGVVVITYVMFLMLLLSSLYSDMLEMREMSTATATDENTQDTISISTKETPPSTPSETEETILSEVGGTLITSNGTCIIDSVVSFEKKGTNKIMKKGPDFEFQFLIGNELIVGSFEEKVATIRIATRIKFMENKMEEREEQIPAISTLDSRLPAAVFLHINEEAPKDPLMLSEQRISEDDILVDLSTAINHSTSYSVDYSLEQCIARVVYREAGNQPFLGQLLVAEDVVNRLRSGLYGADASAILAQGYLVETDGAGNFHVYNGNGIEIIDVPEEAITVTTLALSGSNTSNLILQAATEMRNSQYNLDLGERYYIYGAMYHYNPDGIDASAMGSRTINRVPVSFKYAEHVFYGYWLNKAAALDI